METRNSRSSGACRIRRFGIASFDFRISVFALLFAAGCGAPGEPTPPSPPIPAAVADLTARQTGDGVQLTFTLPTKTVTGERLADPPAVDILRGAPRPDGSPDPKSFRVVYTVPGSLVDNYRAEDHVQFVDPVSPEEARARAGGPFVYRVRTRAARKRASADSNAVTVRMLPVPERISAVQSTVTEAAVELAWTAPARTSAGDPLGAISEYHIYRGELDPASPDAAKDLSQAKWKSPLALVGSAQTPAYRDASFEFGKTYLYTVRTVILAEGHPLESGDSAPAIITPRDTFPPAAPRDLVAAVLVGSPTPAIEVDLSWSINLEPDLAGYRVYRSEEEGTPGQLVTPELLLSPAYRDTSVAPGRRYWYRVTAVDRTGNESAPSAPVAAEVTQPST
jgi:hypothetical protein